MQAPRVQPLAIQLASIRRVRGVDRAEGLQELTI